MILKPQDVFIMLKLVVRDGAEWSYPTLSHELAMSASEVHAGVKRAVAARLMDMHRKIPVKSNLLEFLIHGVKYAYPPDRGGVTRGMPTGYAAQPLRELIMQPDEPPPVWPDPEGQVRGYEFSPLYGSAPPACKVDLKLYELLALVDAIRDGRARERKIAIKEINSRIPN
jgi:hypothetical protein